MSATDAPKAKVLCVDDEDSILKALERSLQRLDVDVRTTTSGPLALQILKKEEIAVIVCDYRMPEMSGSEVLERSISLSPDTYRITLTGDTDLASAQEMINQGQIHQFLTKTGDYDHLRSVVRNGIEAYELKQENRRLQQLTQRHVQELEVKVQERTRALQKSNKELAALQEEQMVTLRATIRVLISSLGLVRPDLGIHSRRVAELATQIAPSLGIAERDLRDLEFAAGLHDFGMISFAGTSAPLTEIARDQSIQAAVGLLGRVRGFDDVLSVLQFQREHFDGSGSPGFISGEDIPLFSRVIAAVNAYDEALFSGKCHQPLREIAKETLEAGRGTRFDASVVDAILLNVAQQSANNPDFDTEVEIPPEQVEVGMVLSKDLNTGADVLLFAEGTELTEPSVGRIREMAKTELLFSSVFVCAVPPTEEDLASARERTLELG